MRLGLIRVIEQDTIGNYHIITKKTSGGYVTQLYYVVQVGRNRETLEYLQKEARERKCADALERHLEFVNSLKLAG